MWYTHLNVDIPHRSTLCTLFNLFCIDIAQMQCYCSVMYMDIIVAFIHRLQVVFAL